MKENQTNLVIAPVPTFPPANWRAQVPMGGHKSSRGKNDRPSTRNHAGIEENGDVRLLRYASLCWSSSRIQVSILPRKSAAASGKELET